MHNLNEYEIIVIGGGIGGYSAAIRASQLGKKVALVNENDLGGTCLNVGCIPTKVLLHSAKLYKDILSSKEYGINIKGDISFDWKKIMEKKSEIVSNLVSGVDKLLLSNSIKYIKGKAEFLDEKRIIINNETELKSEVFIIATGSVPTILPIKGIDLANVIDSTGALSLKKIPEKIVIIGGGVIGLEFAQIFSSFSSEITILEMLPQIGGQMDSDLSEMVLDLFVKQGIDIKVNCKVNSIEKNGKNLKVNYKTGKDEEFKEADYVLVATGRKPYTEGLGLEKLNISMEKGKILVDEFMRTNISGIYAVGDVSSDIMLAHVAEEQGIIAAEHSSGESPKGFDYTKVPSCIYTSPEIAFIGLTEKQAIESKKNYRTGIFALSSNGKSMIEGTTENTFVKLIFDTEYDELLGAHIFGASATELIAELSLGMFLETTAEELISTIHAHPTVSESIKEAAMDSLGRSLHSVKKK